MASPQHSPFETLCDLAQELVRARGDVDIDVLLMLSDSAQQLGLPKAAVQAAIDALAKPGTVVDAIPAAGNPITSPPPTSAQENWDNLPIASELADGPPKVTGQEILVASPITEVDRTLPHAPPAEANSAATGAAAANSVAPKAKPKPPRMKPADRFRRWLEPRLASQANGQLGTAELQELIAHGVQEVGLSQDYAEDILGDICRDQKVSLPTQQPRIDDPKVLQFVADCQEVLAVEGGVTPQARMKMNAKAEELQLSPQQHEQAVGLLDTKVEPNRHERRINSFEKYLSASFAKTRKVGPQGFQKLERTGMERFGLEAAAALRSITSVAKAQSVSILTRDTATELLDRSIAAVIDDQTSLDTAAKDKLLQQGQRIGLAREEVLERIESTLQANREQHKLARKKDNFLILCFAFVIAATVLASGTGIYLLTREKEAQPPVTLLATQPSATSPTWWNAELILATSQAKQLLPAAQADLKALGSKIVVARQKACQSLVRRYLQRLVDLGPLDQSFREPRFPTSDDPSDAELQQRQDKLDMLETLEEVIVQAYVVETDQRIREAWRRDLLGSLLTSDSSPLRDRAFELMFRKLSVAEAVLNSSQLDDQAKVNLSDFLNEIIPPDPTASGLVDDGYRGRLVILLRDQFTGASANVDLDYRNYRVLLSNAAQVMTATGTKDLQDELLQQILPTLDKSLGNFRTDVRRQLSSSDGPRISQFVDLYERMPAGAAQAEVGKMLASAVNLPEPTRRTPDETAMAIRQKLLERPSPAGTNSDQLQFWQQRSRLTLSQPLADADDTIAVLEQSTALALHLAIGEAIVATIRQPDGNAQTVLEELRNLGEFSRPRPTTRSIRSTMSSSQLTAIYQQRFYEYIELLKQSRDMRTRERTLNSLFSTSAYIDDISPELASDLVEYTLTVKPPEEHELIINNIGKWLRWKFYRLALADAVAGVPLSKAKPLLNPLLGTDIDIADKNWRTEIRIELMESARDQFSGGGSGADQAETRAIDAAANYLTGVLQLKSRLRGDRPDPQDNTVPTPGRLLLSSTQAYAEQLSSTVSEPVAQQWITDATRRRELITYFANNDMGQTVILQRAYLRLLAADLIQEDPAVAEQTQDLLLELDTLDREAKSLPEQFRNGELTGIKLLQTRGKSR